MPDTPFFDTEVVPINHIGIPQHTGGFNHPSNAYRLVLNTSDNTLLGMLDKTTGFVGNTEIQTMIHNAMESFGITAATTYHQVHFNGREADLLWSFPEIRDSINGFIFTFAIRIRNSFDLSINKHILIGLMVTHNTAMEDPIFMPVFPLKEMKFGRYGHLYTSQIRYYLQNARGDFANIIRYLRAMNTMAPSSQERTALANEVSSASYHIVRYEQQMGASTVLGMIVATLRSIQTTRGTGKSSPTALMFRRYAKMTTFINSYDLAIRSAMEVLNNETTQTETNN